MPQAIHPMLATLIDKPFDDDGWLFEIKWDGYRAIASSMASPSAGFAQSERSDQAYPELQEIPGHIKARTAILDGEIVALDDQGRPSFGLMQQRTGVGEGGRRIRRTRDDIPVAYYVFDLLYLDGYDLMQADLEQRKQLFASIVAQRSVAVLRSLHRGRATRCSTPRRAGTGRNRRQAPRELLSAKAQQRLAEDQDRQAAGVCHRRLYRPAGLARKLRFDRARSL